MSYAISTLIKSIKPSFLECFIVEMLFKFLGWLVVLFVNLMLLTQTENQKEYINGFLRTT